MKWRTSALLSAALLRLSPLATALIFASVSAPSEYATVALLVAATPLASLVAPLGLDQSLFRAWASDPASSARRSELKQVVMAVSVTISPLVVILSAVAFFLGFDPIPFAIAGAAGAIQGSSVLVASARLRARQNSARMVMLATAVAAPAAAARMLGLSWGVESGYAWILGDIVTSLIGAAILIAWWRSAFRDGASRGSLAYGGPITVHGVAQWLIGSSDRFVLGVFLTDSQLGVYGAASQAANGFNAAASELNKSGLHRYATKATPVRAMRRDALLMGGTWLAVLPLALALLWWLESNDYDDAIPIGMALYASMLPLVLYLPIANLMSIHRGDARALSVSSVLGGAANVATNLALGSVMQGYSGAIANTIGYTVMAVTLLLIFRHPGSRDG